MDHAVQVVHVILMILLKKFLVVVYALLLDQIVIFLKVFVKINLVKMTMSVIQESAILGIIDVYN
jgi:hypothetical protein